jgi:hypothetical protein
MELNNILSLGKITRVVEPIEGVKITFTTPGYEEQLEIVKQIPIETINKITNNNILQNGNEEQSKVEILENPLTYHYKTQLATLSVVIIKINDTVYTAQNRDELVTLLKGLQSEIFKIINNAYEEIRDEQTKIIEHIKKKIK